MKETKLSIIIPCYNSADKLILYLKSIENLDINMVEFVIIDDCSKDNSYNSLLHYQSISNLQIQILQNEKNSGPGYARNQGIKKCKGKYITFLDSDDKFEKEFYSLVNELDGITEMYIFDYFIIDGEKKIQQKTIISNNEKEVYSKGELLVFTRGCPWCKIFLRSLIVENDIKFLHQMRNEDMPFVKTAISKSESFKYINRPLYDYIQEPTSLMHNSKLLNPQNALNAIDYLLNNIDLNKYKDEVEILFLKHYYYSTAISNLYFLNRKKWIQYVKNMNTKYNRNKKNCYLKSLNFSFRLLVFLIRSNCYYLLKLIFKIKKFYK